jgi:glutaredoxin-like protein NrdH
MEVRREMQITVYVKPSCVQCTSTFRALDNKELDYNNFDLSVDPLALQAVKTLGYLQAPVVVIYEGEEIIEHWSGFRPDLIAELAQSFRHAA